MTLWNHPMWIAQWGVVIAASLVAAAFDLHSRRMPNLLTGPLLLAGLIAAAGVGGWAGLLESLAACVLLAAPYVLLFLFAGGGAGDAKLMGGLGAWLGLANGAVTLAAVAIAGALLAVIFALAGHRLGVVLRHLRTLAYGLMHMAFGRGRLDDARLMMPRTDQMQTMPYGVAICVGVCIAAGGVFLWRA